LSLTVRNIWKDGRVERGSGRYGMWTRELAESGNLAFIDLTNFVADEYERMGRQAVAALFPQDGTHTSDEGALLNAKFVARGFKGLREEMWSPWLSVEGRTAERAEPRYVRIPSVSRGTGEDGQQRFLNTPFPADSTLPTLWLIGDSTVRTGRGRGEMEQFGWGDPLENYFDQARINVVNRAMGGTGARTFRTGGFWAPVLDQIKPGDFVILQFGHNDNGTRGALPGTGVQTEERKREDGTPETVETFGAYMRRFVEEIRGKQATPIVASLIPRKTWRNGKIQRDGNGHAAWALEAAKEEKAPSFDLYELIAQRYDAMGAAAVDAMFADQGTHTTYDGAVLNANCVIAGLNGLPENTLRKFLLPERQNREFACTAGPAR
jgi:lysophospholipase L1-like esterase